MNPVEIPGQYPLVYFDPGFTQYVLPTAWGDVYEEVLTEGHSTPHHHYQGVPSFVSS